MTSKPKPQCRFYYEDYYRGQETMECRLPKSRESLRWERAVCDTCPVPHLLRETNSPFLALEGTIRKRFRVAARMEVFAICTRHMVQLKDAGYCAACADEQEKILNDEG